jgi:hypothetical protein
MMNMKTSILWFAFFSFVPVASYAVPCYPGKGKGGFYLLGCESKNPWATLDYLGRPNKETYVMPAKLHGPLLDLLVQVDGGSGGLGYQVFFQKASGSFINTGSVFAYQVSTSLTEPNIKKIVLDLYLLSQSGISIQELRKMKYDGKAWVESGLIVWESGGLANSPYKVTKISGDFETSGVKPGDVFKEFIEIRNFRVRGQTGPLKSVAVDRQRRLALKSTL